MTERGAYQINGPRGAGTGAPLRYSYRIPAIALESTSPPA